VEHVQAVIVAGIQARLDSARLPGKALLNLQGHPIIHWTIDRLSRSRKIDEVFILTSDRAIDDPLVDAVAHKAGVIRGSATDVLSRFVSLQRVTGAAVVVRITGDCPLIDPALVDDMLALHASAAVDYAHIAAQPNYPLAFPNGMNAEALTAPAVERIDSLSTSVADREHVTLAISSHPDHFTSTQLVPPQSLSRPSYKLSVDTLVDFERVARLVAYLGPSAVKADVTACVAGMDKLDGIAG
jgi:spore coat polysaccharide biosynthesis protein SpsF